MCKRFYCNYETMRTTALSYRNDWFRIESHEINCNCGKQVTGFTISDREDGDIIEKMICCEVCASQQVLTPKTA